MGYIDYLRDGTYLRYLEVNDARHVHYGRSQLIMKCLEKRNL